MSGKRIAQASGRDLGQIEDNDQARKVRDGLVPLHSCPDAVSQVLPTPTCPLCQPSVSIDGLSSCLPARPFCNLVRKA